MEVVKYDIDNANEQYGMDVDNRNEHYGMGIDNRNEQYGVDIDNRNEQYGMDNMEAKMPSSFIEQQTYNGNPMKEEREPTNTPFITLYSIILFIWVYTIITVVNYEEIPIEKLNFSRQIDLFAIERLHPRFTWKFPLCTLLSGVMGVAYVYFLTQPMGKYILYIGMFFICLVIGVMIIGLFAIAGLDLYYGMAAYFLIAIILIFLILAIVYLAVSVFSIRNVGTVKVFEVISESCRVLSSCPSITIFSCIMSVIIILIITFMVYVTKTIILSNCADSLFRFYIIINLYCAVALTNFFTNFTQIVITGYVIDWIWMKDPSVLSIRRSLDRTWNYHIGTVAFFSIPLLSYITSIYHLCTKRSSNIVKEYGFSTRFVSQLRVFASIVDFGMIQTAIYGYDSTTAIKAAHDLVAQNNHQINLAVCLGSDIAVGFGYFVISLPFHVEHVHTSVYSLTIPFYIILATTIRTMLVNRMICNTTTSEDLKGEHGMVPQYGTIMTE